MDESHGVGTHSSTLCERGRAVKFTWASPSGGKHGAAAPALLRARTLPSSACSATLLPARRLAEHSLLERLVGFLRGLKYYMVRVALHVVLPVCSPVSNGPTSGVYRKTDLTQNERKRQICAT